MSMGDDAERARLEAEVARTRAVWAKRQHRVARLEYWALVLPLAVGAVFFVGVFLLVAVVLF